tara:strand:- start:187 stop:489 length:303 start_codon:yes stop_codon:yes gene_type:complete
MALTDRSKRKIANEHPKFADLAETFKKHKDEVVEKVKMADISQRDIDASKLKSYSKVDLENAKMMSGNDSLTKEELSKLKKALKEKKTSTLETTGRFKKD